MTSEVSLAPRMSLTSSEAPITPPSSPRAATFTSGGAHNGGAGNPCGGGSTAGWCPADRVDPGGAAVMLGVYAVMHRSSITGYLPTLGSDIDERAVARIEPAS